MQNGIKCYRINQPQNKQKNENFKDKLDKYIRGFISVLFYPIITNLNDDTILKALPQAVLASLIVVCLYGVLFWSFFIASLAILDIFLIVRDKRKLKLKLLWYEIDLR